MDYSTVSRRIVEDEFKVALPRKNGEGNQLTAVYGTLTVTETGCPAVAEAGLAGFSVIVAPDTVPLVK